MDLLVSTHCIRNFKIRKKYSTPKQMDIIYDIYYSEFTYTPGHFRVTPEMKRAFDCDGAVIVRYDM